jgi:hypothetical protein
MAVSRTDHDRQYDEVGGTNAGTSLMRQVHIGDVVTSFVASRRLVARPGTAMT